MGSLYRWGHCLDNIRTAASLEQWQSQTEFSLKGNSQLIKVNLLPNSDQIWFETQTDKHTERRTVSRETDTLLIISNTVSQISFRVQGPRNRIRVDIYLSVSNYVLDVLICVCVCVNFIIPLLFSLSSSGLGSLCSSQASLPRSFSRINKIILVININVLLSKLNTNPQELGHKAHKAGE